MGAGNVRRVVLAAKKGGRRGSSSVRSAQRQRGMRGRGGACRTRVDRASGVCHRIRDSCMVAQGAWSSGSKLSTLRRIDWSVATGCAIAVEESGYPLGICFSCEHDSCGARSRDRPLPSLAWLAVVRVRPLRRLAVAPLPRVSHVVAFSRTDLGWSAEARRGATSVVGVMRLRGRAKKLDSSGRLFRAVVCSSFWASGLRRR